MTGTEDDRREGDGLKTKLNRADGEKLWASAFFG